MRITTSSPNSAPALPRPDESRTAGPASLPWARRPGPAVRLETVRDALDVDHFGLDDVKSAVVEGCTSDLWCAVRRRHSSAGANPARQLSLQPVAVGADDGGNDIA